MSFWLFLGGGWLLFVDLVVLTVENYHELGMYLYVRLMYVSMVKQVAARDLFRITISRR